MANESLNINDFSKKIGYTKGMTTGTKEKIFSTYPSLKEIFFNKKNLIGKQFGRLIVLDKDEKKSKEKNRTYWKCKCNCGNPSIISVY